jgi:uncharacterized protein YcfJ
MNHLAQIAITSAIRYAIATVTQKRGSMTTTPDQATSKHWWQSKTIIGASATIIAALAGLAGWQIGAGELSEILTAAATVAGGGLAIYGRITAKHDITK